MQKTWRILSIDGGGIRGIIPATILAAIEEKTGKHISELFDLIAGTSTGGILTLGLTKPNGKGQPTYTAQELCELYKENIPRIFKRPRSWWGNLLTPKYRSFAFQEVLKEAIGDCRLKDSLNDILIPCYDIEHRLPYIFKSSLAREQSEYDFLMRDVALAASASPTLFYPVRIPRARAAGRTICLVDGGVFANNPSISALAEIKSMYPSGQDKILLVSIGTGKSTRPLSDEAVSLWGYVQWSRPMLELVLESNSESVHEQLGSLLSSLDSQQYYRLQIDLPDDSNHEIDNASKANLNALTKASQEFCAHNQELNLMCKTLLALSEQKTSQQNLT